MLTGSMHAYLVKWAGPDFRWENGPLGKTGRPLLGTRPRSDTRNGVRVHLFTRQNGQCAFCGTKVGARVGQHELCHVVAAGPNNDENGHRLRRGYVPGNIAIGCVECNAYQADTFGLIVPMHAILRPDLIVDIWPTETELRQIGHLKAA